MARRENQGLHIALICMVVLSVLLLGLTYYFWSTTDTQTKKLAEVQGQLTQASSATSKAAAENEKFRTWIGHPEGTTIEAIEQQFNKDVAAVGLPPDTQSYSKALTTLMGTNFETEKQVEDLTKSNNQLLQQIEETRKEEKARADAAEKARDEAIADKDKQAQILDEERKRINREKDQLSEDLKKQRDEVTKAQGALKQAQTKFDDDLLTLRRQIEKMQLQLDQYQKETFDVPAGEITYYNPRSNLITINLGSADGLRPQTTFGVFAAGSNNLVRAVKKGTIEVQKVLDAHRAEARVIGDEILSDPIITGDVIYTPLWAPGGRLHFGIIGQIDLNGDGRDDREQLRRLIRISGGVIDAEDIGPSGKRTGDLTIQTRYLIVGDRPEAVISEGTRIAAQENRIANYSYFDDQADKLGVERITVQQVLNYLGYKALTAGSVEEIPAE